MQFSRLDSAECYTIITIPTYDKNTSFSIMVDVDKTCVKISSPKILYWYACDTQKHCCHIKQKIFLLTILELEFLHNSQY